MLDRSFFQLSSSEPHNSTSRAEHDVVDEHLRWFFIHFFKTFLVRGPDSTTNEKTALPPASSTEMLSRRSFLRAMRDFSFSLVILSATHQSPLQEKKENQRPTVVAYRDDVFLRLKSSFLEFNHAVQESNKRVDSFFDHKTPSPYALEGFYTLFGKASVAQGQLIAISDELREQINLGKISTQDLTPQQLRILKIRDTYDSENIEQYPIGSDQYNQAFINILKEYQDEECHQGFIGVVATKSAQDLGRIGHISVWDPVAERWSEKGMVIVLNSATEKTFLGLKKRRVQLLNTNSLVSWGIEICEEILLASGLSSTWTHNLSGFFRFSDAAVFPHENTVTYPEYNGKQKNIGKKMLDVSDQIKVLLNQQNFDIELQNFIKEVSIKLQQHQNTFDFTTLQGTETRSFRQTFTGSTFVAYVLFKLGVPLFRDITVKSVKDMMKGDSASAEAGLPLGEYSQRLVFESLANNAIWEKKIICHSNSEISNDFTAAIFYIEQVLPRLDIHNFSVISTGFILKQNGQFFCYFLDKNSNFQKMTLSQCFETLDNGDQRIVIFS